MPYNIPQFIEVEDKIIGPLTMRHFLWLLVCGAVLVVVWSFVKLIVFLILILPLAAFFALMIFYKVNGRPFVVFLANVVKFYLKPRVYVWRKE